MYPTMQGSDRRNFLVVSIRGLGAVLAAALGLPALRYLLTPPKAALGGQWVEIGELAKLPLNEPAEIVFRRERVDGWKVVNEKTSAWVVRKTEAEVVALAPGCTHLGCAYHFVKERNEFLCPCHTSTFAIDGAVTSGPAPRGLDRYETRVRAGKLSVGRVIRSIG